MAIVDHYEECLRLHGDTHRGVDWPNPDDAARRYDVMLGVTAYSPRPPKPHILDFGCGAGHLLEHMQSRGIAADQAAQLLQRAFCAEVLRELPAAAAAHQPLLALLGEA
jgi:2-polyprenyl-3-methyl-5-hydroxy-6-metoxy-1,4-benzoquinol methylase